MKTKKIELYIHIPFCKSKCRYCDFCSFQAENAVIDDYITKLKEELIFWGKKLTKEEVVTVFIGGGTPSYLKEQYIKEICNVIFQYFKVSENAEITIEANPGTVDLKKLCTYRESGINRISFGLQSTIQEELQYLGRIHTYEQFLQCYNWAREAGFCNISVDLMSAIPKQTIHSYEKNLRTIAELSPEHISAYSLIIEEGTPFYEDENLEDLLPSEEDEVRMYQMTAQILKEYGYEQYEISNYAKKDFERRHNLGYWSHIPYLGVGLNASSYMDERRFENPSDMKQYLKITSFDELYSQTRPLSVHEQMEEFMFLGLRKTKGISKNKFEERFGCSMDSVYEKSLKESIEQGFIKEQGDQILLTQEGILVSNQVLCEFLFDEESS